MRPTSLSKFRFILDSSVPGVCNFRQELWMPKLLDREYYQVWLDAGAKSMEDRCRVETQKILAEHKPEPIPVDLDRALNETVRAARLSLPRQ